MDTSTPKINKVLFIVCGVAFVFPSLFFIYYTARLLYMNLTMEDAAAHRTGGMLIGAIAFPLAAILLGLISWFCFKRGLKTKRSVMTEKE
jgi:Na+/phosphate symporter